MKKSHLPKNHPRMLKTYAAQINGYGAVLCVGVILASCHPLSSKSNVATTGQDFNKAAYPVAASSADAFAMIGKRMMGLNPITGDQQDHIGLMNVADMLGFKYAFNDCGANWVASVGNQSDVDIYAPHANGAGGSGGRCNENDNSAPVHYTFKDWTVLNNYVTELDPYTDVPQGIDMPAPSAAAPGAQVMGNDAQVKIVDGRLVVVTPEVVTVTGNNQSTDPQTLTANYSRQVSTAHQITTTTTKLDEASGTITITAAGGIQPFTSVSAAVSAGFKIQYAKSVADATTNTLTTTVQCQTSISQKPGCAYRLTIKGMYVQSKGRYMAYIKARPNLVGLSGKLSSQKDCQNKQYRNKNGSCNGQNVSEVLGAGNLPYNADLKNRLSGGDGKWYWQSLSSLGNQKQADGKANIDIAADYLTSGDYDQFAMKFEDVTETITQCMTHVEVISGGDNCRVADPVAELGTSPSNGQPVTTPAATPDATGGSGAKGNGNGN